MRLALELVSVLIVAVVVLLIFEGYVGMRRESASFETDLERDAHRVGLHHQAAGKRNGPRAIDRTGLGA